MPKAAAARVEGEPPAEAARSTVGARLMRAMYPAASNSTYLRWFGLALLALAAIFPWLGGPFYTRLAIETFLLGAVALSVDILLGYAGLLSLGQAAYFGLAAYISALMYLHVTQSFWLVMLDGQRRGRRVLAHSRRGRDPRQGRLFRVDHVRRRRNSLQDRAQHACHRRFGRPARHSGTDASRCFRGSPSSSGTTSSSTTPCSPLSFCIYVGTRRVLDTGFGSVLRAIRDNADRVPYLGYNPFWYKLLAYMMAAQIAAFGGLIYPLLRGFVAPHLFGFEVSTKAVVMSLVGGVGTLLGPLVGSVIITFLESFVGSYTERHLFMLGVIFIVFVMFLPDGLCGLARRTVERRRKAGS